MRVAATEWLGVPLDATSFAAARPSVGAPSMITAQVVLTMPARRALVLACALCAPPAAAAAAAASGDPLSCVSQGTEISCEQSLETMKIGTCADAQSKLPDCAHCLCTGEALPDVETACTMECLVEYLQLLLGSDRCVGERVSCSSRALTGPVGSLLSGLCCSVSPRATVQNDL